jgi:hypothetical protein
MAEQVMPSLRDAAQQQETKQAERTRKEYTLAPGREWRITKGVGKTGITVSVDAQGALRPFLTFVPEVGKGAHSIPLGRVYAALDAGDLDAAGARWIVDIVGAPDDAAAIAAAAQVDAGVKDAPTEVPAPPAKAAKK